MAQVCGQCSRVNPQDAVYCYYDGISLAGRGGGPLQTGSQSFPTPFVFPSGASCRSFDQLALTCQQNWSQAVDLMKQGFLGSFFGGMGRVDLAMAAQDAAKFPDADRGLDQLLAKLPTQALQAPRLQIEPTVINLGQVKVGEDRQAELHLSNLGMRLLYGSIASNDKWLLLGDAPGLPQKVFQTGTETNISIQIRGQHLRAGRKPLEAKLVVDSNGGTAEILVRADVPPVPFEGPIFEGSLTPRQVAEKAKANPAAAAPLFENGSVAKWFAKNGWTYPVQGPSASGLGAVQQFFEALGLAKAPKVRINVKEIVLKGDPGQVLTQTIEVTTDEKKPVYAHAVSDQPWIDGTKVKLAGRSATITLAVTVPNRPGETLESKITVQGNGNQRFPVPFKLTISGEPFAFSPVEDEPTFAPAGEEPTFTPTASHSDENPGAFALDAAAPATPSAPPPPSPNAPATTTTTAGAVSTMMMQAPLLPEPKAPVQRSKWWPHAIPAILLLLVLIGTLVRDLIATPTFSGSDPIDPHPRIGLSVDYAFSGSDKGSKSNTMGWGLVAYEVRDGKVAGVKKLTFDEKNGTKNSAMVLIDTNKSFAFGDIQFGKLVEEPKKVGNYGGYAATFRLTNPRVQITQTVEIMPGNPVEASPGDLVRLLDTCLIKYVIENQDTKAHQVGFRFLLDTYIGSEDGVPFAVPGIPKLLQAADFDEPSKIPDYIQALESPNLRDPGTIAQLNLKLGPKYEVPSRVVLTHWTLEMQKKFGLPFEENAKGKKIEVPPIGNDSAVAMYWDEKPLQPKGRRTLAFSYGVGNITAASGIGILNPGSVIVGREFSVTAIVQDPAADQKITLEPPEGLRLSDSTPATQAVPVTEKGPDGKPRPAPVTWRVTAPAAGRFTIKARTTDGHNAERKIVINAIPLF